VAHLSRTRGDPLPGFLAARTCAQGACASAGQDEQRSVLPSRHRGLTMPMRMISQILIPGVVTSAALVVLLTLAASAHANPQRAQLHANFQATDIDKNEQLNVAEFKAFINLNAEHKLGRANSIRRFGMYNKAFKEVDVNGDGVVSKEEIATRAQQ